jgi:hypothetical protein
MKQFQVPQFIDIEDKIIGPLTLKQFLYILGGGAVVVIARALFVSFLFYIISLFAVGASFALAFYKVNGVPFPKIIMAAFSYFSKPNHFLFIFMRRLIFVFRILLFKNIISFSAI